MGFGKAVRAITLVAALGLPTGAPAVSHADDGLTIITENYPPLNYLEEDQLKGAAVDIVRAVKARLGVKTPIKVLPWARGYNMLKTRPGTVLFSTTRSAKREAQFKWVGPLAEKKAV